MVNTQENLMMQGQYRHQLKQFMHSGVQWCPVRMETLRKLLELARREAQRLGIPLDEDIALACCYYDMNAGSVPAYREYAEQWGWSAPTTYKRLRKWGIEGNSRGETGKQKGSKREAKKPEKSRKSKNTEAKREQKGSGDDASPYKRYKHPNTSNPSSPPAAPSGTSGGDGGGVGDRKGRKKNPVPSFRTAIDMQLAKCLWDLMIVNDPKLKERKPPKLETWAEDINKIQRLDGWDYETIEAVLRWSQSDQFWRTNILSGQSLRKYFEQLRAKARNAGAVPGDTPAPIDPVPVSFMDDEKVEALHRRDPGIYDRLAGFIDEKGKRVWIAVEHANKAPATYQKIYEGKGYQQPTIM